IVLGDRAESGEYRLTYLMEISPPLDQITQTENDDTAVIAYTAGTNEPVKGVELTHDNILSNVDSCCEFFKFGPEDSVLGVLPFYHLFGQTLVMNFFLRVGAKVILMTNFKAASILKMIEKEKPTYFVGVPPVFQDMLTNEGDRCDIRSLKFCLSTGNGLKQETMEAFEEKFNVFILEGYGLTEASPMVSFNRVNTERKAGSIGLPLPGVEMKIVDKAGTEVKPGEVGEIIVQGPNVMKRYLNQPEKTNQVLKNGWLRTGDLALLHDDGYSFIVVQKKNVIVKSGFQIYPGNIEKLLCEHPKIEDAVVFGVPISDEEEQQIHTYILLKKGEQVTPDEIIQYGNEHMPAYMCPQIVHFVSSFPVGPTGRVMREKIKYFAIEDKNK
ncbi:AMP-binding protein, partial [bacterium]|nr:AMP-binding protein [bacterium]